MTGAFSRSNFEKVVYIRKGYTYDKSHMWKLWTSSVERKIIFLHPTRFFWSFWFLFLFFVFLSFWSIYPIQSVFTFNYVGFHCECTIKYVCMKRHQIHRRCCSTQFFADNFSTVWCIPGIVCITYSINATLYTAQSYCLFISFWRFLHYTHCYPFALLASLNPCSGFLATRSHFFFAALALLVVILYYPAIVWRRLLLFMLFLLIVHKGKLGQTESSLLYENDFSSVPEL